MHCFAIIYYNSNCPTTLTVVETRGTACGPRLYYTLNTKITFETETIKGVEMLGAHTLGFGGPRRRTERQFRLIVVVLSSQNSQKGPK